MVAQQQEPQAGPAMTPPLPEEHHHLGDDVVVSKKAIDSGAAMAQMFEAVHSFRDVVKKRASSLEETEAPLEAEAKDGDRQSHRFQPTGIMGRCACVLTVFGVGFL